jgi:hypothetical protein
MTPQCYVLEELWRKSEDMEGRRHSTCGPKDALQVVVVEFVRESGGARIESNRGMEIADTIVAQATL